MKPNSKVNTAFLREHISMLTQQQVPEYASIENMQTTFKVASNKSIFVESCCSPGSWEMKNIVI